jgi:uncharacterized membrane protein
VCTSRGGCQRLEGVQGTVGPSPGLGGDILIYDIKDGFVYEGTTFEAAGWSVLLYDQGTGGDG